MTFFIFLYKVLTNLTGLKKDKKGGVFKKINMKQIKTLIFLVFIFSILPFNSVFAFYKTDKEELSSNPVSAPTLFLDQNNKNLIKGLTAQNTEVLIYIDKTFAGFATVNQSNSQTNNFFYFLNQDITEGKHTVQAIARDKISLRLSVLSAPVNVFVSFPDAPTMIAPRGFSSPQPIITGLTPSGTYVKFYIDDKYIGKTDILYHNSGTANFAYKVLKPLKPGIHKIYTKSKNKDGRESKISNILYINVQAKLPAPTLKKVIDKKILTGLSKNNTYIYVYIDNNLDGKFKVKNHKSGTANFAYTFSKVINDNQEHTIYTIAKDFRGKTSEKSNIIKIKNTKLTKQSQKNTEKKGQISAEASYEEKTEQIKTKEQNKKEVKELLKKENQKTEKTLTELEKENEKIVKEIINGTSSEENASTTDTNNTQNKTRLNLLIFIGFLIAVIAWIFWVNKELIKEKKEDEMNEDE